MTSDDLSFTAALTISAAAEALGQTGSRRVSELGYRGAIALHTDMRATSDLHWEVHLGAVEEWARAFPELLRLEPLPVVVKG